MYGMGMGMGSVAMVRDLGAVMLETCKFGEYIMDREAALQNTCSRAERDYIWRRTHLEGWKVSKALGINMKHDFNCTVLLSLTYRSADYEPRDLEAMANEVIPNDHHSM